MEKSCPGKKGHPPTRATLGTPTISLQTVANHLHEKQIDGLGRRVICLAKSPLCIGGVTLLAGPTFLDINTWDCPAGSNWSIKARQSEHVLVLLAWAKGPLFYSYECLQKLT